MSTGKIKFLSHQSAAALNKNAILNYIRNHEHVSRTDICERLKLSRASATQIIKQLIEQDLVIETGTGDSKGGRKPSLLKFKADAKYVLAFDWHLKSLFLVNLHTDILYSRKLTVAKRVNSYDFVTAIKKAIMHVKKDNNIDDSDILGLGLVMPGLIDSENGVVILLADQEWRDIKLRDMLQDATGIRTIIEADGNMQAVGEYFYGTMGNVKDFVLLEVEDEGIGMALILNGELQKGRNHMTGEIGHIRLSNKGPECICGKKGCLEALIKESVKRHNGDWMQEAVGYLGLSVSIIINILDPEAVIVSGAVAERFGERMVAEIKKTALDGVLDVEKRQIIISISSLGQLAGVKGICEILYNKEFKEIKSI